LVSATTSPTVNAQVTETRSPSATPTCSDNLTLLEDLSLTEKIDVVPGDSLDKRWLVENSGTCNWDEQYRLKFISGTDLNANTDQALYPARSGAKATLRILFTAPTQPGTYQSSWRAYNPQGQPFGDPIFLQVVVSINPP